MEVPPVISSARRRPCASTTAEGAKLELLLSVQQISCKRNAPERRGTAARPCAARSQSLGARIVGDSAARREPSRPVEHFCSTTTGAPSTGAAISTELATLDELDSLSASCAWVGRGFPRVRNADVTSGHDCGLPPQEHSGTHCAGMYGGHHGYSWVTSHKPYTPFEEDENTPSKRPRYAFGSSRMHTTPSSTGGRGAGDPQKTLKKSQVCSSTALHSRLPNCVCSFVYAGADKLAEHTSVAYIWSGCAASSQLAVPGYSLASLGSRHSRSAWPRSDRP